jgi:hypothetical protein
MSPAYLTEAPKRESAVELCIEKPTLLDRELQITLLKIVLLLCPYMMYAKPQSERLL